MFIGLEGNDLVIGIIMREKKHTQSDIGATIDNGMFYLGSMETIDLIFEDLGITHQKAFAVMKEKLSSKEFRIPLRIPGKFFDPSLFPTHLREKTLDEFGAIMFELPHCSYIFGFNIGSRAFH